MRFLGFGKKKNTLSDVPPLDDSSFNTDLDAMPPLPMPDSESSSISDVDLPVDVSIPDSFLPEQPVLDLPDTPSESSFKALPEFSDDDFTPPTILTKSTSPSPIVSKTQSIKDVSTPGMFSSSNEVEKPKSVSIPKSSYVSDHGVFVPRASYVSLLLAIKDSSKDVHSLSSRHKNLVEFDISIKKLFDAQATGFDELQKDILAVLPFLSKK